jgi:hypothetical protein
MRLLLQNGIPKTKEWVIAIREYKAALRIIRRFYGSDAVFEENEPPERWAKSQYSKRTGSLKIAASDSDYAELHLLSTAPPELVKVAYRTLSKLNHPDISTNPEADKRMKSLNQAYEVITRRQGKHPH